MPPSSKTSSAGAPRRRSTRASRRPSAGTSRTNGGGGRCASAMPASGSGSSRAKPTDPMRVVVTGREGQIARSLMERGSAAGHAVVALGRPQLDLTDEADAIARAIEAAEPDVIVSSAAYTAVDKAEGEPDIAFAVNERGAGAVARAARMLDVPLVHLSTDY